jgi:enediyne biosynthesis protein E4
VNVRIRTTRNLSARVRPAALAAAAAVLSVAILRSAPAAPRVVFTDVTAASGITFTHASAPEKKFIVESMSGGVGLFDFDRDGWLDVYLANSPTVATAEAPRSAPSALWRNNHDGTFTDVTTRAGVGDVEWAMGVTTGDYDNDGWVDLYVTCYGANHLFHNNGDGTFADVTARAGVGDPRWSTGAAFGDYDNDGKLDLFVANYVDLRLDALPEFGQGKNCAFRGLPVQCGPRGLTGAGDSLYHNNGDGTFTDVSTPAGVSDAARRFGMGVAWCDFNGDGRIDLYVANDSGPNYLYRNNGDNTFTDVGLASGTALSEDGAEQASMGVTIGDYDHRGLWSIVVTNFSDEYNALYRHQRDFLFTDASYATRTAKASLPYVGWGTGFFDYDNDGWLDLLVVNGHVYPQVDKAGGESGYRQRKLLYHNDRDGTFAEVAAGAGAALNLPAVSRGAAFGDIDNDGDIDVIVNNLEGPVAVLRNDGGNENNYLALDLVGRTSNRSALGARVKVIAGDLVQVEERRGGGSYLSQNDSRFHFGLEKRSGADRIEVRWPDGTMQAVGPVPANHFIRISEGDSPAAMTIEPWPATRRQ